LKFWIKKEAYISHDQTSLRVMRQ